MPFEEKHHMNKLEDIIHALENVFGKINEIIGSVSFTPTKTFPYNKDRVQSLNLLLRKECFKRRFQSCSDALFRAAFFLDKFLINIS